MRKLVLADMEKCYACLGTLIDGMPYLFFGSEGNGQLRAFYGADFSCSAQIWEGGGGTMSIVSLPGEESMFLASRGFYSLCDAGKSSIELVKYQNGAFSHQTVAYLPWLHRFDVVCGGDDTRYVVAATLAVSKASKDDWSLPGHIYWAEWNDSGLLDWKMLPGDFFQNHGFYRSGNCVFFGSREGAFRITPPLEKNGAWHVEQILPFPVSDVTVCDINGDGIVEIGCIRPFHGNQLEIYQGDNCIYHCTENNDFYHAITNGTIQGKTVFVGGARWKDASLFLIHWQNGFHTETVDQGCGPSNAAIFNMLGADLLLAANRQIGQAAVYLFPAGDGAL